MRNISGYYFREKYTTGKYTHQMLADEYGVSRTTATLIIQNKRWKNDPQQIKDNS